MTSHQGKMPAPQASEGPVDANGSSEKVPETNGNKQVAQTTAQQDGTAGGQNEASVTPSATHANGNSQVAQTSTQQGGTDVASATRSAAAAIAGNDFDTDASKYFLKDLLHFQQHNHAVFSRLDFTKLKAASFHQLFPTYEGEALPPKGYRASAELVQRWRSLPKEEQDNYNAYVQMSKVPYEKRSAAEATRSKTMKPPAKIRKATMELIAQAPIAPPLSKPIPFLDGKLFQTKLLYQQVPDGFTDWNNVAEVTGAFPAPKGLHTVHVPLALLLDAQTDQDKLVVMSWWRQLGHAERQAENESMKRIYAAPRSENRLLPLDFWVKLAEREANLGKSRPKKFLEEKTVDPNGNDFYSRPRDKDGKPVAKPKKDGTCRGWQGGGFDTLFQACYAETVKNVTMKGGAKALDRIPVYESIARTKGFKDIAFVRNGEDYVLRSVDCTGQVPEGSGKRFCENCHRVTATAGQAKRNVPKRESIEAKQKEQIASLRSELKSALRREKRLRDKHNAPGRKSTGSMPSSAAGMPKDDKSTEEPPSPKKMRASFDPPTHNHGYNFAHFGGYSAGKH